MKIVFVSGKGGTGKTTFATNFYYYLKDKGRGASFMLDADVEAPNSHLFFKGEKEIQQKVYLEEARIDEKKCNLCKKCVEECRFKALIKAGSRIIVLSHLCHGCGLCKMVCPQGAIYYEKKEMGEICEKGSDEGKIIWGDLRIGESLAPPVIEALFAYVEGKEEGKWLVVDAPPGASCPAVATVEEADIVIVVAEATLFGWHDFLNIMGVIEKATKKVGVIINKADWGDKEIKKYCEEKGIPVILEVPFDKDMSKIYGDGKLFYKFLPHKRQLLEKLEAGIEKLIGIYKK